MDLLKTVHFQSYQQLPKIRLVSKFQSLRRTLYADRTACSLLGPVRRDVGRGDEVSLFGLQSSSCREL
jgi:hypothetical protein